MTRGAARGGAQGAGDTLLPILAGIVPFHPTHRVPCRGGPVPGKLLAGVDPVPEGPLLGWAPSLRVSRREGTLFRITILRYNNSSLKVVKFNRLFSTK